MRMRSVVVAVLWSALVIATSRTARGVQFLDWPGDAQVAFKMGIANGRYVGVPGPANGLAISDDGVVALLDANQQAVRFYPSLGKSGSFDGARLLPLDGRPTVVVYHRMPAAPGYFIVALSGTPQLRVIDAGTLAIVRSIPIACDSVSSLAAPGSISSQWVYYSGEQTAGGQPVVGRIDLFHLFDAGRVAMPDQDRYDLATCNDGTILYARRPGTSPAGFMAFRISEANGAGGTRFRATRLVYEHETRPAYVPDPSNTRVACGRAMFTANLVPMQQDLPGQIVAFDRTRPLIFAFADDGGLLVLSSNSTTVLTRLAMTPGSTPVPATPSTVNPPAPVRPTTGPAARRRIVRRAPNDGKTPAYACLVDETDQTLVLANAQQVVWFKLDESPVKSEPMLGATMAGTTELSPGTAWTGPLTLQDPSTVVSLGTGQVPAGLTLAGNALHWTPAATDVGTHTVTLHLAAKGIARDVPITLLVSRPSLALNLDVRTLSVSRDGTLAVAVGTPPQAPGRQRGEDGEPVGPTLVLIDLRRQAEIARRTLAVPVTAAAVDAKQVYVGVQGSDALLALSAKDLSDVKRVFTPGPVFSLVAAGPRLYVGLSSKPSTWYATPDLTPAPDAAAPGPFDNQSTPVPSPVDDGGWYDAGIVYGADFRAARWVLQDDLLPRATMTQLPYNGNAYNDPPVTPWGIKLQGTRVVRQGGQVAFDFGMRGMVGYGEERVGTVLPDVPAVAVVARGVTRGEGETLFRSTLDIYDVVDGNRQASFPLTDGPRDAEARNSHLLVTAAPGRVVAVVDNRLFVTPTSALPMDKLAKPLQLAPPANAVAVAASGPTTLTYKTTGGRSPIRFSLGQQVDGIDLDARGVLTISPERMQAQAVASTMQVMQQRFRYLPGGGVARTQAELAAAYRAWAGARFQALTGHPAAGYPVGITVAVVVTDADQQTFRLLHTLLWDMPTSAIDAKLAEQKAADDRQAAMMREAQARSAAAFGNGQGAASPDVAALQKQVADLKAQNQMLQAKVDALTDVLARGRGGATAKP